MTLGLLRALARERNLPVAQLTQSAPNPAAGANLAITVPAEYVWQPVALTFSVAAANAGSARVPDLVVTDGNGTVYTVASVATLAINATTRASWVAGYALSTADATGLQITNYMPDVILLPGWTIGVNLTGLQGADQISGVKLTVVSCFTGNVEADKDYARQINDHAEAIRYLIEGAY